MIIQKHQISTLKVISENGGERSNLPIPKNTEVRQMSQWMIDHIYEVIVKISHPMVDISKHENVGLKDAILSQARSAEYLLDLLRQYSSPPSPRMEAPNVPSQSDSIVAINNWIILENERKDVEQDSALAAVKGGES